jgi:hypothetical protein
MQQRRRQGKHRVFSEPSRCLQDIAFLRFY